MLRSHPIVSAPLLLGLVLLASQTLAADFTSRVAGVSDSDTITVLHSGKERGRESFLHLALMYKSGMPRWPHIATGR